MFRIPRFLGNTSVHTSRSSKQPILRRIARNMASGTSASRMAELESGFLRQAEHCTKNGAPVTGKICKSMIRIVRGDSAVGQRIAAWPCHSCVLEDAVGLRIAGGIHNLHLTQKEDALDAVYAGAVTDQQRIEDIVDAVVRRHEAELLPWLDNTPQTNEVGRAASFAAAFLWLSSQYGECVSRLELNEIGSSGGLNLMMDQYHFTLGDTTFGPVGSTVRIRPKWSGSQLKPAPATPEIVRIRGCDISPVDLTLDSEADRMRSYIWAEMAERKARLEASITLLRRSPPSLEQADAAVWLAAMLAEAPTPGVARVLIHSIVWQYIPAEGKRSIEVSMLRAAEAATKDSPLVWVSLETNRGTFKHELQVRFWDGESNQGEVSVLAEAQAHGNWIHWLR